MAGVTCIADHVVSPLGIGSEENWKAVSEGRSALRRYESLGHVHTPVMLSRMDRGLLDEYCKKLGIDISRYTFFERFALASAVPAVRKSGIDAASPRTLFIVSTTKANVCMLDGEYADFPEDRVMPAVAAAEVSAFFENPNAPLVVCNACTSGVCAQIEAMRCLESGQYDNVVVTGADEQSPFIVSGFMSFKALSDEPCRPFDKDRRGLNLGECSATVVLTAEKREGWHLLSGAIRNDANHISGPSRTGEGSYLALKKTLEGYDSSKLSMISVHGTATLYNDEMESIAVERAGLSDVPLCGFKGYYGHTMGAAGVLESILSMRALEAGIIPATRGFAETGVSGKVNVSSVNRSAKGHSFVKLLSGFGGCNAALLYEKE